jgi:hypothetical protein
MQVVFRICGYLVHFGRNYEALILEEERALSYAAKSHGTMEPVYKRVEIEDGSTDSLPISDPASA